MTRRLILRDWEAEAWHAGRLGAVVRLVKPQPVLYGTLNPIAAPDDAEQWWMPIGGIRQDMWPCPLGLPGNPLWIAESFNWYGCERSLHEVSYKCGALLRDDFKFEWSSPATMPQWASRSTAVHLGSRLVRVRDMPADDAINVMNDNGQAAWDANVWVWIHRIGRA